MNVSHTGSAFKKTAVHIQAVRFAPASGLPDVNTNHSEQSLPSSHACCTERLFASGEILTGQDEGEALVQPELRERLGAAPPSVPHQHLLTTLKRGLSFELEGVDSTE